MSVDAETGVQPGPAPGGDPRYARPVRLRPTLPIATLALIACNVIMAYQQYTIVGSRSRFNTFTNEPTNWALGAKVPSLIAQGEWWRLVTASFLHGSYPHLVWNMICLFAMGCLTEFLYGIPRILTLYILSCVSGTALSTLLTPNVSLGSSTGILGLLGAFIVHNYRFRDRVPPLWRKLFPVFVAFVSGQLALDMVQQQIDFFGHVGGLLGGAAIALVLQSRFAPPESTPRERLPLLAGLCASLLLWIYGGLGVMLALPQETLIVAAAQARGRTLQIAYLRQLTEQRPYFTEARLHLAALLFAMQRGEEAIREVTVVARTNPPLVSGNTRRGLRRQILEFQLTRGRPDLDRKDWTGAIESNQYVIDHSPSRSDRAQAHNQLAWILADKLIARLDEAEAHSRASLELQPSEPAFQDTLAWIFYRQGRYREALDQQQLALRSAEVRWGRSLDNTAELQYHLGAIYEKMRRFSEARVSYARALRARPIYPAAVEGLRRLSGDTKPADPGDPLPSQDPAVTRGII